jgi:hypothetical protein
MPTDTFYKKGVKSTIWRYTMYRKREGVKSSNAKFKRGMRTHVKNLPSRPKRGGYRL